MKLGLVFSAVVCALLLGCASSRVSQNRDTILRDAQIRADGMLKVMAQQDTQTIRLPDYVDEPSYRTLCGRCSQWSYDYFKAVTAEQVKILKGEGYKIEIIPIRTKDYAAWRSQQNKPDDEQSRGEFMQAKMMGPM